MAFQKFITLVDFSNSIPEAFTNFCFFIWALNISVFGKIQELLDLNSQIVAYNGL